MGGENSSKEKIVYGKILDKMTKDEWDMAPEEIIYLNILRTRLVGSIFKSIVAYIIFGFLTWFAVKYTGNIKWIWFILIVIFF